MSFFLHSHILSPGNFSLGKCVNLRQTEPKAVIFLFFWIFFTLSQKFYTHGVTGVTDKYQVCEYILKFYFLWHWWILPRDHHWISRRIGVGLEEAPSLHSHAGQVFNALLSTTLSFESDPDFRHLCSLSFILIIYHLQAIRELTGRYFGQVSHRVKKKLATIYKNDFLMFGYNPLIWVGEKISFIIDSVILLNFGAVGELNFFHQNFEWS